MSDTVSTTPFLRVQIAHPDAKVPKRMSHGAAGYDLYSVDNDVVIPARGRAILSTGICIAIPEGTYARVAPRSGLAAKGIDVGAGVVDSDYRAPVGVILYNHNDEAFCVRKGERIAQLILEKICVAEVKVVHELDVTERGEAGFGSTGTH